MDRAHLIAAYETAVAALTPLGRAVFLMHRADGLSYREIAEHLDINIDMVEACLVYALTGVARMLDFHLPPGEPSAAIADAEAALLDEFRVWCARTSRSSSKYTVLGILGRLTLGHAQSFDQWLREGGPAELQTTRKASP